MVSASIILHHLEQKAELRRIKEEIVKLDKTKNTVELCKSMRNVELKLYFIEQLIYEYTILLAQAQCFDFLREIDKKEGRVIEELMPDGKMYV